MAADPPFDDTGRCVRHGRLDCPPCEAAEAAAMSDEELIEVVMRYAEGRGDGCNWDCPNKRGGYCLDGHAEAYNAREVLRRRGYA